MNLNALGSATLGVQAILLPTILVIGSRLDGMRRALVLGFAFSWLLILVALAAEGLFSAIGSGAAFVGISAVAPVLAVLFLHTRSGTVRSVITAIPLTLLVAVHAGRLLGVNFLLLHAAGRLPSTFAYLAGWGDILVAADSILVAIAVYRKTRSWRPVLLIWNCIGVADLVVALTLGAGSAAGSPIRFIFQEPSSALLGTLPWFLIPGYLVPLYLIAHAAIFFRLFGVKRSDTPAIRELRPQIARFSKVPTPSR